MSNFNYEEELKKERAIKLSKRFVVIVAAMLAVDVWFVLYGVPWALSVWDKWLQK